MNTRTLLSAIAVLVIFLSGCGEKDHLVTISTQYGDMKVVLFDETPEHKATFLEFAEEGKYDSTIFHRVINEFMIQGGDVAQKPGAEGQDIVLIPAEFRTNLIHTRGMLAGARTGDNVNPDKKSGTQFYIVQGKKYSPEELDMQSESSYYTACVTRLNQLFQRGEHKELLDTLIALQKENKMQEVEDLVYDSVPLIEEEFGPITKKVYTQEQYEAYETIGGTPFLDFEYTVYGKVIDGLDVIDAIAGQETSQADKPVQDIFLTMKVEKMSKSKISELYNYTYPN